MSNRKRALLISCAAILICVSVITGVTFALFSDSQKVTTHLKAGSLDIELGRTYAEYAVVNDEGVLESKVVTAPWTDENNIFGIDSAFFDTNNKVKVVPGSYFLATITLVDGDGGTSVKYDYDVSVNITSGAATDLAKQLQVKVYEGEFTYAEAKNETPTVSKRLSDCTNFVVFEDTAVTNVAEKYTIIVEFVSTDGNNPAMNDEVSFDITVTAEQAAS